MQPGTGGQVALVARRAALAGGAALLLGGCETVTGLFRPRPEPAPAPQPETATLELTLAASPLVNPDLFERPSPVVLRAYLLANADVFNTADFAALFEADAATLGPASLGRREVILTPGSVQVVTMEMRPEAQVLGVVVGYRAFERATWRAAFPVQGRRATRLRVDVNSGAVQIRPAAATTT